MRVQNPDHLLDGFQPDAVALTAHHGLHYQQTHRGCGLVAYQEKWLRQVLLNLLANALRVSPPGATVILKSDIGPEVWKVSITDQGPGLPRALHHRIFERFARFNIPDDGDRGSGLGLAICQSIIELHGGRIFAEDGDDGRGLCVTFEIPLAEAA
ncbi:MAG: sensor histidine kinase, partial [Gammaproteobacteria bacterium]